LRLAIQPTAGIPSATAHAIDTGARGTVAKTSVPMPTATRLRTSTFSVRTLVATEPSRRPPIKPPAPRRVRSRPKREAGAPSTPPTNGAMRAERMLSALSEVVLLELVARRHCGLVSLRHNNNFTE
jgi:hypothetical protein